MRAADEEGEKAPLFVGHEPGLTAALSLLASGSEDVRFGLRKPGFAAVGLRTTDPPPEGTLLFFLPPRVLRSLAR
jgi:phosphohistidine phosphatase SixA